MDLFLSQNNKYILPPGPFSILNKAKMTTHTHKEHCMTGILTILSGVIALGSMLFGLWATEFNFETFSNPVELLDLTGNTPTLIRWFMLLDMFGYYLLLLPVVWYAHRKLEASTPWATLFTSAGFAYVVMGAMGAAALAAAWPSLIISYQSAAAENKEIYKAAFLLSNDLVVKGIWNTLEVWLAGVWWLGLGIYTIKARALKITTIVLGTGSLIDGAGEVVGLPGVAEVGLNIYLLFAIVWAIWIGAAMIRGKY